MKHRTRSVRRKAQGEKASQILVGTGKIRNQLKGLIDLDQMMGRHDAVPGRVLK